MRYTVLAGKDVRARLAGHLSAQMRQKQKEQLVYSAAIPFHNTLMACFALGLHWTRIDAVASNCYDFFATGDTEYVRTSEYSTFYVLFLSSAIARKVLELSVFN